MRYLARSIAPVLWLSFVIGCGFHKVPLPPRNVLPPPAPLAVESDVDAHVSVNLKTTSALIQQQLPAHLDSGTEKINVPANITLMVPTQIAVTVVTNVTKQIHRLVPNVVSSTCKKAGIFSWIFFPCQVTNQVDVIDNVIVPVTTTVMQAVSKATAVKTPLNVDVAHDLHLAAVTLTMQGNRLQVDVDVDFSIAVKADAGIATVGLTSCGVNEARPIVRISEPVTIGWKPDGTLGLDKQPWSLQWISQCNLTFADVPLAAVLKLSGLEAKLDSVIDDKLSTLPSEIDFTKTLKSTWSEVQIPREIARNVWLVVNPETAFVSNPVGDNGAINFDIGLSCEPHLVYEAVAPPVVPTSPTLTHMHLGSGFSVSLEGSVSYDNMKTILRQEFAGKDLPIDGHQIHVADINDVYPSGDEVVIGVKVSRPVKAQLWLIGRPVIDSSHTAVSIDNVDYSLETKNFLISAASWILHSSLQKKLESKAHFDLSPYMRTALQTMAKYDGKVTGPATLHIRADKLSTTSLFLTQNDVRARVLVAGAATVEIR